MTARSSALLTDLYQVNMMQAYLDRGATDTAVFELFARNLPPRRGALVLFSGTVTRLETMIRLPNSDLFRRNAQSAELHGQAG